MNGPRTGILLYQLEFGIIWQTSAKINYKTDKVQTFTRQNRLWLNKVVLSG